MYAAQDGENENSLHAEIVEQKKKCRAYCVWMPGVGKDKDLGLCPDRRQLVEGSEATGLLWLWVRRLNCWIAPINLQKNRPAGRRAWILASHQGIASATQKEIPDAQVVSICFYTLKDSFVNLVNSHF